MFTTKKNLKTPPSEHEVCDKDGEIYFNLGNINFYFKQLDDLPVQWPHSACKCAYINTIIKLFNSFHTKSLIFLCI